jgi:heme/copper-type cytochrome/quinol oxidase subunit 2
VPIPAAILTLGLSVVLVLVGLWVGQNVNLLPIDASANAPVYDELFQVLFSIGTSLLLGIVGLLIYSLIRYRRLAGDTGAHGIVISNTATVRTTTGRLSFEAWKGLGSNSRGF